MPRELGGFSDGELLEELARRQNARDAADIPPRWCHDCAHYRTWAKACDPPPKFNPCSKKHKMQFRPPADADEGLRGEYGFFRAVCTDRKPALES